jgi:uncharacterized protein (TIGR02147 family)
VSQNEKTIFEYSDFREFLRDRWSYFKTQDRKFSLRYFARVAGFKSHNFLKHVLSGKSCLSDESIEKFAKAMKLNREEKQFFRNLVLFNQAKVASEKQRYGEELLRSKSFRKIFPLAEAQFNYFNHWYFIPIREFVTLEGFKEDYEWIAQKIVPPIKPTEAEKAVRELLALGMLERDEQGRLKQRASFLSTSDEVSSSAIAQYHREMIKRAAESIDNVPREKRDISNMTITVSEETAAVIKEKIQNFRKELIELVSQGDSPEAVYQINFQMFPLVYGYKEKAK